MICLPISCFFKLNKSIFKHFQYEIHFLKLFQYRITFLKLDNTKSPFYIQLSIGSAGINTRSFTTSSGFTALSTASSQKYSWEFILILPLLSTFS